MSECAVCTKVKQDLDDALEMLAMCKVYLAAAFRDRQEAEVGAFLVKHGKLKAPYKQEPQRPAE